MESVPKWKYQGKIMEKLEDFPPNCVGFIYCIVNKTLNKKYIGRKILHNKKTLKPLKNTKRKRKLVVESSWNLYTGSSDELSKDIALGHTIEKEIIHLCYSKKQMSYYELKYQMMYNVLEDDTYYNSNIMGRYFKKDL